jgi:glutathione peroxidase
MMNAFNPLESAMNAYDFSFQTIDGKPMPLTEFRGKVVLVVNTASKCGLTPQYAGLEELYKTYRDQGLVVVGVPANDFGKQEPGTNDEIAEFCATRFAVDFPMAAKETVIGGAAHPFYRWASEVLGEDSAPKWNFHKYLIGKDGALAGVFGSRMAPDDPAIIAAIKDALAA